MLCALALALPAFGQQEKLIGTWEYLPDPEDQEETGTVLRLELKAGGQFEVNGQSVFNAAQLFGEEDQEGEGVAGKLLRAAKAAQVDSSTLFPGFSDIEVADEILGELLVGIFPDTLTITAKVTGTWEADETRLRLDGQASQMFVNGLEPKAFFEELAHKLAGELAAALEIPAEEYPAFEAEIVAGFSEEAGADSLTEDFDPDDVDVEGTYVIEGGILAVTDEEGEVARFRQVLVSAVEALSWGQLKAAGF
jgi:hypothetical protein